jgi:thiamine-monophosphate kinase
MSLGEFELIDRYFRRPVREAVLGLGDDCALWAPTPGRQLAVSSDMLVEGRHFLPTVPPVRLGHKALAVNLSDLAACGARPRAFTLSLALPRVDEAFLAGFSQGLFALADRQPIELIGGDTTAGPVCTISITVFGEVAPGQALLRSGARPGDDIWVSGCLGDARLALEACRGQVTLQADGWVQARDAMELPQPRVALGLALPGLASAAIDLSDGLLGDLGHVLRASRVGAQVRLEAVPRSALLAAQPAALQRVCLLTGGDDYELVFTAPAARRAEVRAAAADCAVPVQCIGVVQSAPGLEVIDGDGRRLALDGFTPFDHFKA